MLMHTSKIVSIALSSLYKLLMCLLPIFKFIQFIKQIFNPIILKFLFEVIKMYYGDKQQVDLLLLLLLLTTSSKQF